MSNPTETSGRPLPSNPQQRPEPTTQPLSVRSKRRRDSQSSDDRTGGTKSPSRRRPTSRIEAPFGPHAGTSRGAHSKMQRSASPNQMSPEAAPVKYTRTGRISKAKKGEKVHNCECGKSYTRAEHLRRHQRNHNPDALVCDFPECGRTFHRSDLLQRHRERHELGGKDSPQTPFNNTPVTRTEHQRSPSVTAPGLPPTMSTPGQTGGNYQGTVSPQNESGIKQFPHNQSRHQHGAPAGVLAMGNEMQAGGMQWNVNGGFSPYSSSSGFNSPIHVTDYQYQNHPYPQPNRTRASSTCSFNEPVWAYPSRSPTSATSTLAYGWNPNDHSPVPPAQPFVGMTTAPYSMSLVGITGEVDYTLYPKSLAQRDEEDQTSLFPEEPFGMGNTSESNLNEQYLDNFWRLFHPSFPLVHQSTFEGLNSPPMLRAAMIAIGAQYSGDPCAKRKARMTFERCIKLLDARANAMINEEPRLCDYQTVFLLEVLSQYRALRAATRLSKRFADMYTKFSQQFGRSDASNIIDNISALNPHDPAIEDHWRQWVELKSHQRLLHCCYILEYQQSTLLARPSKESLIVVSGLDMPFPVPAALWDAKSADEWAIQAAQFHSLPLALYEVTGSMNPPTLDHFQSCLLIASHYNHFGTPAPFPSVSSIDLLVDQSPLTQHHLLTAKLVQVTPLRALLAVAGESWIFSEKVPTARTFHSLKNHLKSWLNELWNADADPNNQKVKEALTVAIQILRQGITVEDFRPELGAEMGLYYAALVIWAVTVAASTRLGAQGQSPRLASVHTLPHRSAHYTSTTTHLSAPPSTSANPMHTANIGLHQSSLMSTAPVSPSSMPRAEILAQSMAFLETAVFDLGMLNVVPQWPRDVAQWQQGCFALLRWVKMALRNGSPEGRDSVVGTGPTSAGTGRGSDSTGELIDGVISMLEKVMTIMARGYDHWGI